MRRETRRASGSRQRMTHDDDERRKKARIATLDARYAAEKARHAREGATTTKRREKEKEVEASETRDGRGLGAYACSTASERAETRASERGRGTNAVDVDNATSDDEEKRRAYVEKYVRGLLATRSGKANEAVGDEDDILRTKLGRDKALLLDDATKNLDHGETRAKALKERFAKANAARMSRTALRKRGFYGASKEKYTWSALATLRSHWDRYARGLIKDVKRDEAKRRLTRGIDLHGCVVKVTRHSRTPDVVGREGCVAFVGGRFIWLVARRADAPLKVLIDGGTFEFTVDEYVVKLNHADVATLPSA